MDQQNAFYELTYYTLSHKNPNFIHQYVVDTYAAQTADENTRPIKITFALIGLYLHLEKQFSGKEVQNAHVLIAKKKKVWPKFVLPKNRGEVTVFDVLKISPGEKRDEEIDKWSKSVWNEYKDQQEKIINLLKEYGIT
jgi:hypothetical protein